MEGKRTNGGLKKENEQQAWRLKKLGAWSGDGLRMGVWWPTPNVYKGLQAME